MLRKALAALLLAIAAPSAACADDGGVYGDIEVVAPAAPARGFVILFSDVGGRTPRDRTRLEAIAKGGAIAVGVDTTTYLRNVAHAAPGCLSLYRDAEILGRELQRQHPTDQYRIPIVAGQGLGGALASRIVAQAPLETVSAGVAVDPSAAAWPLDRELCTRPMEADDRESPGTLDAPTLKNPWTVALTPAAPPETRAHFVALARQTQLMSLRDLPNPDDASAFFDLIRPFIAPERPQTVNDLPLVELPAASPTQRMAVFLSGDGGWRDFDKRLSERLQELGISVVGWDSLRYFWRRKTAEQAAADLTAVIDAYERKWGCDQVAVIGYSFGADAMPFIYGGLNAATQKRIAMISILSPGEAADWEIKVAGWLGVDATPLGPAVATLPGERTQCFFGDRDEGRTCDLFAGRGAEIFSKVGAHQMDGDYDRLGREIADGFARRLRDGY